MENTAIYRLSPIARDDDPNWDLARNEGEIIVRALTSGDARLVAAEGEAVASGMNPQIINTKFRASAFLDPHIYAVTLLDAAPYPPVGPREVLVGTFAPDALRP